MLYMVTPKICLVSHLLLYGTIKLSFVMIENKKSKHITSRCLVLYSVCLSMLDPSRTHTHTHTPAHTRTSRVCRDSCARGHTRTLIHRRTQWHIHTHTHTHRRTYQYGIWAFCQLTAVPALYPSVCTSVCLWCVCVCVCDWWYFCRLPAGGDGRLSGGYSYWTQLVFCARCLIQRQTYRRTDRRTDR